MWIFTYQKTWLLGLLVSSTIVLPTTSSAQAVPGNKDEIQISLDLPETYPSAITASQVGTFYQSSAAGGQTYYVEPHVFIGREDAKEQFDKKCASYDQNDEKRIPFKFEIHMYPGKVLSEAREQIIKLKGGTAKVSTFPYVNLVITYGRSADKPYAVFSRDSTNNVPDLVSPKMSNVIRLTCSQADDLVNGFIEDIDVSLELQSRSFDSSSVEAHLTNFFTGHLKYDFERKEKQTGGISYVTRSRSRSGGFFGALFGGSTSARTGAATVDNRKRYISGDAFNDSLEDYEKTLRVTVTRDGLDPDDAKVDAIVAQLRTEALTGLTEETVRFKQGRDCGPTANSGYCMVVGNSKKPIPGGAWLEFVNSVNAAYAKSSASIKADCISALAGSQAATPTPQVGDGTQPAASLSAGNPPKDGGKPSFSTPPEIPKTGAECDFNATQSAAAGIRFTAVGDTEKKWVPTSFKAYGISADKFRASYYTVQRDKVYSSIRKNKVKHLPVQGDLSEFETLVTDRSKLFPYVASITQGGAGNKSVAIDPKVLKRYCGDRDGCMMTVAMKNYDLRSSELGESANFGPVSFFYNAEKNSWRTASTVPMGSVVYSNIDGNRAHGTLGDNAIVHAIRAWGCYVTEGNYTSSGGKDDDTLMYLHTAGTAGSSRFPYPDKECSLIIRN